MARNNMKLMPLSGDDKAQLLRKLHGSPHFEKTLTASTVSRVSGHGSTLPSWFVQQHGDKFRKLAFLRTGASTKVTWPVNLSVQFFTPNWIQVRFCGGWNVFITSNGLVEGDSLVFALVAMSEFEVYVFRKEGPLPSQAQITNHSIRLTRKKTKQSLELYRDRQQSVAGSSKGGEKVDGLNHKSDETVADENVASASGTHRTPTSIQINESPDYLTHQMVTWDSLLPGFWKNLTATNVCRKTASMEIPQGFLKMYGSQIHSVVKLQGLHDQSPVRTMRCHTPSTVSTARKRMRQYLRSEWREFANENHLHVGQVLFFTLAADSFFVVREWRQQPPS